MEEQDKQVEESLDGRAAADAPSEETQVGQIMQGLAKMTRRLPASPLAQRDNSQVTNRALRERIQALVAALGDPSHVLHQQAVDDLVAIGAPAVPALNEALNPNRPWLAAYYAADALGQIGDGRAAGPLLEALRHPNGNVRWSAVRALAVVGDARALLELRRVAREERGKTSWGESIAGAAQSALNQMQSQNMLLRTADLIKTALACVLMLVAISVALSIVAQLRAELSAVGRGVVDASLLAPPIQTTLPTAEPTQSIATGAEPSIAPTTSPETDIITGTVETTGNVRSEPVRADNIIGGVTEGDEIILLAAIPSREWYLIRLGDRYAASSKINSADGTGWISRSLMVDPPADIEIREIEPSEAPAPGPTEEP